MRVLAFDPFVSAERFRELGVEKAETSADVYREADFITIHLPKTAETRGWLDAEAFAQMKDGVRDHQLRPRRAARRRGAQGRARLRQGRRRRARRLPGRADHRLPAVRRLRQRRRHPAPRRLDHRGPGPRRRADRRAGRRRADRRRRLDRGQHPRGLGRRTWRCSGPFLPLVAAPRPPRHGARRGLDDRRASSASTSAASPRRDTRLLTLATLNGVLAGHTEEEVNLVNAPLAGRRSAGSRSPRRRSSVRARLHRPRPRHASRGDQRVRVVGTTLGQLAPPAPARGVGPALQPPARRRPLRALPLLRPARHGRPRRHRLRRARHQHLPGRRRARRRPARTAAATTSP